MIPYVLIALFGVFISGISQVMLKKSAMKKYDSALGEYLNPLVIGAYTLFVAATLCSVVAFGSLSSSLAETATLAVSLSAYQHFTIPIRA